MAKTLAVAALGALGAGVSPARAELVQEGTLRVASTGKLSPSELPRQGTAPIAVTVGGRFTTTDGSLPPQLRTLRIEINRQGRLDTRGLPTCRPQEIHPASSARALTACREALVGRGRFSVQVDLAGQEPYPTGGRLLVFNARLGGRRALLGQIHSARPFATSFLIPFTVRKIDRGRYGTLLTTSLPSALGDWGHVTGIEMRLSRRYSHRGVRRSFIAAGCPAPKGFPGALFPLARTTFGFAGGLELTSTLVDECRVRG